MKTIMLLVLIASPVMADTLLDKPATVQGSKVYGRDAYWNKAYREARGRNPGGTEAQWCAVADAKVKERRAAAGSSVPMYMQRKSVDVYIQR